MPAQGQITDGKAIVTLDSNIVHALDASSDWSEVSVGDIFTVPGSKNTQTYNGGVPYYIAGKTAPGSSTSGFWEIQLSAAFAKPSGEVFYAISTDFWPVTGAPRAKFGTVDTRLLFDLAIGLLDAAIGEIQDNGGGGGGGTGGSGVLTHKKTIVGIDAGANSIYMQFSPPLSQAPLFVGRPVMIKLTPGDENIDAVSIDSITSAGYNVNLSGLAIAGHVLSNFYIPAH